MSSVADLAILAQLLDEYRPRLLAMLRRRLPTSLAARVDPEDILSEAFLKARHKYARYRQEGNMTPYAWLYRLVLDTLIGVWRRESRSPRDVERDMPFPEASSMQLVLGLVQGGTGPSSAAARNELRQTVRQVADQLKDKDQQVLWMRHQDGLSHAEIATVLGVTENAAMVRYVRALQRFKELWLRLHPESIESVRKGGQTP